MDGLLYEGPEENHKKVSRDNWYYCWNL